MTVIRESTASEATDACDFCRIASGLEVAHVVYTSPTMVAFFPDEPITLGHTLVIPKAHVGDFLVASDEVAADVAVTSRHVGRAIMRALHPEGMNVLTSVGKVASQTVFHLHLHVVPRWRGDALGELWPQSPHLPAQSKELAATQIRDVLSDMKVDLGGDSKDQRGE